MPTANMPGPTANMPGVVEALRPLSVYERLFWAVDKVYGFNFSMAVSFRGTIARARWNAAFAQAQKRHPFLNVSLNQDDPHAPVFMRGEGFPIPLVFQRRTSSTEWQRVMECEVAEPFDLTRAPLLRAVLLEDDDGCDLVLTANHIIVDGIGVVALVGDLLAALSGETLAVLPVPPSAEDRVAEVRASQSAKAGENLQQDAVTAPPVRLFACRKCSGKPEIRAVRLSRDKTALLQRCCRQQRTTIGAVLLAALVSALRRLQPALRATDLQLVTPVDARPYLGNAADLVLSISSGRAVSTYPDAELWARARALKSQLAPFQSFAAIEATFGRVQAALAAKMEASALVEMLIQNFGHDLLLSNLKSAEFRAVPADLTVEAVWGPSVLLGVEGEQMVGVATFDGALHLVHTSFTPVAGLLEATRQMIANACEAPG